LAIRHAAGNEEHMAKTKTTQAKKVTTEKKTPASEAVARDREMVLDTLRKAGLKVEKKTAWTKVLGREKRRAYVANRGPQVHLTFQMKGPGAEHLSEAEAKRRHLGSVRTILFLDRADSESLKEIARSIVAEMK
jgi:hypothetical protein